MSRTTDAKLYRLDLQTEPTQPVVGYNTLLLTVSDARSNAKIDHAAVEVVSWITVHGHGSSKKPTVKERGGGKYIVESLYFTMEGDWGSYRHYSGKNRKGFSNLFHPECKKEVAA